MARPTLCRIRKLNKTEVKISAKNMRQLFVDCDPFYIKNHCRGSCCTKSNNELSVAIAPNEEAHIEKLGGRVVRGLLQPREGKGGCPFQNDRGLCGVHSKGQPIGCAISPFHINFNNTIIIRFRYLCMNCHRKGTMPAYKVFRRSLDLMFDEEEAMWINNHLDAGGEDIWVWMKSDVLKIMQGNRKTRMS